MITSTEPITISEVEFDVLWKHLDLDETPLILDVASPGATWDERKQIERATWDELGRRGLGVPSNVDYRLEDLMRLLFQPKREIDARLWVGHLLRAIIATDGRRAVQATWEHGQIALREADVTGLPRHALALLPQTPAGPGASVTLRSEDFAAVAQAATPQEFEQELRARGVRAQDVETLKTMFGKVLAQGQFGSAARDSWGSRHRADRVISFYDTEEGGRYLQARKESVSSEAWTTISPADPRRMLQQITQLHEENVNNAER
ncbi:ESAT-6 protein secretion system EspG family protein [Herbihabitans rhizosphaerae]|uniref:ESAT-6 protein secretion system EspG family protein n=1 Tax=Herbihabitans rhizosphaerae TaxID=1872711 RepID=A0A4Q7KJP4_9PSEU|nr:ESX secretion-associated protein EspG [Herbihabitans rhizosphaerae]RZS36769.1 ESAT-6 protein secretion system EspG family protein [Herbihabitans rhizosphaerae]